MGMRGRRTGRRTFGRRPAKLNLNIRPDQKLDYKDTVEFVINEAFSIQVGPLLLAELAKIETTVPEPAEAGPAIRLAVVEGRVNKVLVAVSQVQPKNAEQLNEFFKKEGESLRVSQTELTNIVGRNRGSKNLFYYDRDQKKWTLSALGRFKLNQLVDEGDDGE